MKIQSSNMRIMRLLDNIKKMGSLLMLSTCLLTSCDYLDVVPPEQPGLGDAVKDPESTLGFLYSCYAGIKGVSNPITYTNMEAGSADEYAMPELWGQSGQRAGWGLLTPDSYGQWKWGHLYRFIGQCHLFLSQLPNAVNVSEVQKKEWAAEANMLIAYYHFLVLEYYGPCPITDSYINMDTPSNEYHGRYHYDYVVNWIAMKLDEAAKDLPASRLSTEWGRATSTIAKAIKARMLVYAASPLWNGGFPYPEWRNKSFETPGYGKELVSRVYDREKWERALTACKDALEWAEGEGGCALMTTKESEVIRNNQTLNLSDLVVPVEQVTDEFKQHVFLMRYIVASRYTDGNREMVWGLADDGAMRSASLPVHIVKLNSGSWKSGYSGISPLLNTVERFYTRNGRIPEKDTQFFDKDTWYESAKLGKTDDVIKLNANREPRFYAWLSFDGDQYGMKISAGKELVMDLKNGDAQGWNRTEFARDHCVTGYMSKKYIEPDLNYGTNGGHNEKSTPRPLFRVAELYLNLAECYAALEQTDDAIGSLNVIRKRAGVRELTTADLQDMSIMEWVRNERFIELWGEGHRYYDARRWMIAPEVFAAGVRRCLNMEELENPTFEELNKPVILSQDYKWENRMYLAPIFTNEVYKNPQMVQAPEY